ncbi:MAG: flagellar motor switch protein FliM [Victivallales bacterium]|nr:flagellar motor switch protein FliM [Victivallales bacterium]
MANILNQDEINSLLGAMERGKLDGVESGDGVKVTEYNFRRPNLVTKDQLRSFQDIHTNFAREMISGLSLFLRTGVEFELINTEQQQYGEFIKTLPGVTHSVIFTAEPLPGVSVLEVNLSLIFGVLDMLLGGQGDTNSEIRVPTDIEIAIITPFIERIVDTLQNSWRNVMKEVSLHQVGTESDPEYIQAAPVDAPVVVMTFDVKIGFASGAINICYPLPTIQAVNEYLEAAAGQMDSYYGRKSDPETRQNIFTSLLDVQLPVSSVLGEAVIRGSDLMKLRQGDIVVLNRNTADVLPLNVAGKQMFVGRPGRIKNNLFVKICERCKKSAPGPAVDIDWNEK